jgi:uncharacterized membrane protein (UPF0127 family)
LPIKNYVDVVKRDSGAVLLRSAHWRTSWWQRLVGLQFHRPLHSGEAIILVGKKDSVTNSSIHMFFVFFPIAAVWVNAIGQVTSVQLAKPWRPYYASPDPACFVLETTPDFLSCIQIGDFIDFIES